jgi:hypothetical protein
VNEYLKIIIGKLSDWRDAVRNYRGKRVLVHEILSLQILITAVVGVLAVAGLYWGGQWVLQDNYSRWALQWTEELNELGAPLYLPNDLEVVLRLESYVRKYPEISRVVYYRKDGTVVFSIDNDAEATAPKPLSDKRIELAAGTIGEDEPYLIESGIANPRQFEIVAPVWTESIVGDGLFDFAPESLESRTSTDLAGFVGLHLDLSCFITIFWRISKLRLWRCCSYY